MTNEQKLREALHSMLLHKYGVDVDENDIRKALQSVSAAPQEGKTVDPSDFSMGDPHPCDVSRAAPATPRGDGGEVIKHKPDCPSIPDDPFGHPSVVAECDCNAPPAATDGFVRVPRDILNELAWPQYSPGGVVKDQGAIRLKLRELLAAAPQSGKKEDDVCRVTLEPHRWRFTLAGGAVCRDCNSPPAPSSPPSKGEGET